MPKTQRTKSKPKTDLKKAENKLIEKYGDKIVPGTIKRSHKGKHANKLTVEIRTKGEDGTYDGNTMRVATSDVWQVHHTPEVTAELRRRRRHEKARQKRATAKKEHQPVDH